MAAGVLHHQLEAAIDLLRQLDIGADGLAFAHGPAAALVEGEFGVDERAMARWIDERAIVVLAITRPKLVITSGQTTRNLN